MKKILFLIHDLSVGGAEKVLVNLVNNMDYTKFDITVISLFGGGINEIFLNDKVHYHSVFKKVFPANSRIMKLLSPRLLHKLFIKDKYDIEISYLEGPSSRIISGCPHKGTILISWVHTELSNRKRATVGYWNYKETQKCYQQFHKIICVSQSVKQAFEKIYPKVKNLEVLYNTNESAKIMLMKDELCEENIFKENEIKLVGVGRVIPLKGFEKLAIIHKRLRGKGYPIHTYILGIGPETETIKRYCLQNEINDSFTFLGYQENPYKYVAKCDLFVCSSYIEGFSTAATEALIMGIPVITTRVSGMEEMLGKHDEYGVIVENNEEALYQGIKKLLDDNDLLKYYAEKAEERGKYFSTDNTVNAVETMLLKQMQHI